MSMQAALPQIRPISDLRTRLNDIESLARETREPIIMTKNGAATRVGIGRSSSSTARPTTSTCAMSAPCASYAKRRSRRNIGRPPFPSTK